MSMRKGPRVFLTLVIILVIICGGVYAAIKTTKNIGVTWTEQDYQSYVQKVKRLQPQNGEYNLVNLSSGKLTCKGKRALDINLTNEEISSALSKENSTLGPIKDVKVKFLGNNEAEATFKLTDKLTKYVNLSSYGISDNQLFKAAINGTSIYLKAKVDKASSNSIQADIRSISIGRIPLSGDIVQKIEDTAVPLINRIMQKYTNLDIKELSLDNGSLHYKATIPDEVIVSK